MVGKALGITFEHMSYEHVLPPDCDVQCMLRDPQKESNPN